MKKYMTPELNIDEFDFLDILTNSGDGNCYAWEDGVAINRNLIFY